MFALQCLNARHFIYALNLYSLFYQFRCLLIECIDVCNLFVKSLVFLGRQPITDQVRLDGCIFLKVSPHGEEKSA